MTKMNFWEVLVVSSTTKIYTNIYEYQLHLYPDQTFQNVLITNVIKVGATIAVWWIVTYRSVPVRFALKWTPSFCYKATISTPPG